MRIRTIGTAALALALAAPGCAQKSDVEAVQASQKEILAKLEKMEKDQAQILAKVNAGPAAPAARPAVDPNKVYEIPVADSAVRGPKDAPVTVTMFSDFQCPFCAQAITIVDEALKSYPTNVKFIMKQFPLRQIHPNAEPAAEAAIAAGKQGKFWEMHDELFRHSGDLSPATIRAIAEKLHLNVAQLETDVNSPAVTEQLDVEVRQGKAAGVRGTPTFFINGRMAQTRSLAGFKTMIEDELRKKSG